MVDSKFCPLPWNHLFFRANKDVFPCCETNLVKAQFNETIEKTANAPAFNNLRLEFLKNSNLLPSVCYNCEVHEQSNKVSMRQRAIRDFHDLDYNKAKSITNEDGSVKDFKLGRLDIRSSNLCNYKCRFCGIVSSNSWLKDHKALGNSVKENYDAKTGISEFNIPWEDLKTHLPYVKRVKLAGGEPVMMAGTYQLLEELIAIGNTRAKINLITNASVLTYGKKNIIDLLQHFSRVIINLSIDGIGLQHEWLRSGKQDWDKVKTVIDEYTKIAKQKRFLLYFHTGVSWMNMWHLEDMIAQYPEHRFQFNPVKDPDIYSLQHFYEDQVIKAHNHYTNLYNKTKNKTYKDLANCLTIKHSKKQFNIDEFKRVTDILDKSREQSFTTAFPEHAWVLN